MNYNKKLSAFSIYLSSLLQFGLTIVQGLLLVPLYLKYFGTDLYGVWLTLAPIIAWMTIVDPGLSDIIRSTVANSLGSQSKDETGKIIGSWLAFQLFIIPVPLFISFIIAPFLPDLLDVKIEHIGILKNTFIVFCAASTLTLLASSLGGVLHGLHCGARFAIVQTLTNIIGLIVSVIGIFNNLSILSIPLGLLVRQSLTILFFSTAINKFMQKERLRFSISRACFQEISRLTPVILVNKISSAIFRNIETFLIPLFFSTSLNPVFVLTGRALALVGPLTGGASQAAMPSLSHLWGENNYNGFFNVAQKLLFYNFALLTIIAILFLSLNESFISVWVGKKLFGGSLLTSLLMFSFISDTIWYSFFQVILATGQYKGVYWNGTILNIARGTIMFFLLKQLGLIGLPIAVIVTNTFLGIGYLFPKYYRLFLEPSHRKNEIVTYFFKKILILTGGIFLGLILQNHTYNISNWLDLFFIAILYTALAIFYIFAFDNDFRRLSFIISRRFIKIFFQQQ